MASKLGKPLVTVKPYKFPKAERFETPLFRLQVRVYAGPAYKMVTLRVTHAGYDDRGATKYRCYQSVDGKPMAVLWGAFSPSMTDDGKAAKYAVLTHAALKPGDTDAEFFADYTEEHQAFVVEHGEDLFCQAEMRYGYDGTGKKGRFS